MGVLEKVKFWKRDDFALEPSNLAPPGPDPTPPPYDLGAQRYDPVPPDPMGQHSSDPFSHEAFQQPAGQQAYPQYPQGSGFPGSAQVRSVPEQYPEAPHPPDSIHPRDVELILAKLDAIKSELDSLHQRVRRIEQMNDKDQKQRYW